LPPTQQLLRRKRLYITGGHATLAEAVDLWTKKARGYEIRSDTYSGGCGHYTQIFMG
jgi:hypothetical protein